MAEDRNHLQMTTIEMNTGILVKLEKQLKRSKLTQYEKYQLVEQITLLAPSIQTQID